MGTVGIYPRHLFCRKFAILIIHFIPVLEKIVYCNYIIVLPPFYSIDNFEGTSPTKFKTVPLGLEPREEGCDLHCGEQKTVLTFERFSTWRIITPKL